MDVYITPPIYYLDHAPLQYQKLGYFFYTHRCKSKFQAVIKLKWSHNHILDAKPSTRIKNLNKIVTQTNKSGILTVVISLFKRYGIFKTIFLLIPNDFFGDTFCNLAIFFLFPGFLFSLLVI